MLHKPAFDYNTKPVAEHTKPTLRSPVSFKYTGKTGLTVIGSITRTRYRFNYHGDSKLIDERDVSSMAAIPVLKIDR